MQDEEIAPAVFGVIDLALQLVEWVEKKYLNWYWKKETSNIEMVNVVQGRPNTQE